MVDLVANWWTLVLRGCLATLFGLMAFLMPGMALLTLVFMFGFYTIAEGVFNIVAALRKTEARESQTPTWVLLVQGIISIAAGLIALFLPGLTAFVLLFVIAGWAIATGVMEIIAAIRLRKQIKGEWLLATAGVLSIVLGVLLALFPGPGALAMVLWIGAYAVLFGALLIALGIHLRRLVKGAERDIRGFPLPGPSH